MSVQEFVEYIRVLLKRWWVFLILCGATVGGLLYSFYSAPTQYEATTRFWVSAPPSTDVALYSSLDRPTQRQQAAAIQSALIELIENPTIIQQAVDAIPGSSINNDELSYDELRKLVTVEQPTESNFVWVSVLADEPQEAADLANALVDTVKQYYGRILARPSSLTLEFIGVQVKDARQKLQALTQELMDFRRYHKIEDLPAEIASERTIIWNLILERDNATVNGQTELILAYNLIISEHYEELERLTALSSEYEALNNEIGRAESLYGYLLDKESEAKLKENEILRAGYVQVVEPAYPPSEPVSPFNVKIFAVGFLSSLIVSAAISFALEYIESQSLKKARGGTLTNASRS
jgi:uncharacterized protein involved in exopolysaccharide biosynthesis